MRQFWAEFDIKHAIWSLDWNISRATAPCQSKTGSNGNKGELPKDPVLLEPYHQNF